MSVDIARRVSKLSQHVTCCWASFQCPQRTCRWRCKTVAETDSNRPMMRCHDALKQVTVSQCTQALLGSCAPNLRVGDFTHTQRSFNRNLSIVCDVKHATCFVMSQRTVLALLLGRFWPPARSGWRRLYRCCATCYIVRCLPLQTAAAW